MANSAVDIWNLALSAVGTRSTVAAENEVSREAEICKLWYEPTVKAVLRAAPWPAAVAHSRLALLNTRDWNAVWTSAAPPPDWTYEYASPSDLLRPRYLHSYAKFDVGVRNTTRTIITNEVNAVLSYTRFNPQVQMWDDQLILAITHALAANISMPLHGKTSRAQMMIESANGLIAQARTTVANEKETGIPEAVPAWLAIRGVSAPLVSAQYIYPDGPLLSLSNVT